MLALSAQCWSLGSGFWVLGGAGSLGLGATRFWDSDLRCLHDHECEHGKGTDLLSPQFLHLKIRAHLFNRSAILNWLLGTFAMLGDPLGCHDWSDGGRLLASRGWRPWARSMSYSRYSMPPCILTHTQQRTIWSKLSAMRSLGKSATGHYTD